MPVIGALASLDTGSAKDGDQVGFAGSALNGENRHAGVEEGDPASFAVEPVIAADAARSASRQPEEDQHERI